MIKFKDFQKIDIRVGTVIEAERVDGSNKLLRLLIDLGSEKRQLVSGIAKWYKPEDMINKQITMIANLEPRVIMGFESQGMLLAVDPVENAVDDDESSSSVENAADTENAKNEQSAKKVEQNADPRPIFLVPDENVPNGSKVV